MSASSNSDLSIRHASREDVPLIYQFIQQKSEFDRAMGAFSGTLRVSAAKLDQTLFTAVPYAYVLLAEQGTAPIGFALYGFRYSSFAGQPSIWLDDLFVLSEQRSSGVGTAIMARLVDVAVAHACTHLAWTADARNVRALNFYTRLGANIIQQQGHRCWLSWIPQALQTSHLLSE